MGKKRIHKAFLVLLLLSFSIMSFALPGNHLYQEVHLSKNHKAHLSIGDPVKCNYILNDLIEALTDGDKKIPETDPSVQPVLSAWVTQYNIEPRCILINLDLFDLLYATSTESLEATKQRTYINYTVRLRQPSYYSFLFRLTPF